MTEAQKDSPFARAGVGAVLRWEAEQQAAEEVRKLYPFFHLTPAREREEIVRRETVAAHRRILSQLQERTPSEWEAAYRSHLLNEERWAQQAEASLASLRTAIQGAEEELALVASLTPAAPKQAALLKAVTEVLKGRQAAMGEELEQKETETDPPTLESFRERELAAAAARVEEAARAEKCWREATEAFQAAYQELLEGWGFY